MNGVPVPPVLATGSFDASAAIWVGRDGLVGGGEGDDEADGGEGRGGHNSKGYGDEEDFGPDSDADGEDYRFAVVLEGHDSEIKSIAWSVHGNFLATCSRDKSLWIWECLDNSPSHPSFGGGAGVEDEDNYETVAVLQEHDGDVKCVAWHPEEESCIASASYDEAVRVWREDADGEWSCIAVCLGHTATVWCVDWEGVAEIQKSRDRVDPAAIDTDDSPDSAMAISGPRLVSSSADGTIRVWRRNPKPPRANPDSNAAPRIPSIIRNTSDEETWVEEAQLPQVHDRAIYAVAWSRRTGKVVSAGSDGRIVVYEEREGDVQMDGGEGGAKKEWVVLGQVEGAHGVYEINHVCWAKRFDRERSGEVEEVVISTGDDGEVKVWSVLGA